MRRAFPTLHVRPRPRRRGARRVSRPLLFSWGLVLGAGIPFALLRALHLWEIVP